jgi:glyoxylase-like metal-dependent hydrolase (beta-lactamase superfamily II)
VERALDQHTTNGISGDFVVDGLAFPYPDYPAAETAIEVASGLYWISTPVPFVGLKQVNLWLLRDGEGWTMIDCGYGRRDVRDSIEQVWRGVLRDRPVTRLIITHNHPDHTGNARWICERWGGLRPLMSQPEWFLANLAALDSDSDNMAQRAAFYRRHGLDDAGAAKFLAEVVPYKDGVQLPPCYRRLRDGDVVAIDGDRWRVITGEGHSPEHVSLYCAERRILIAGDQILPAITTNVSTWPNEPEFDAVGAFLDTCRRFLDMLDADTLVLPSHRKPFYNVRHRLRELARHHAARLNLILDNAPSAISAGELMDVLFKPGLDGHQIGFAMGEAIAHLNHLVMLGHMRVVENRSEIQYRRVSGNDAHVKPCFQ